MKSLFSSKRKNNSLPEVIHGTNGREEGESSPSFFIQYKELSPKLKGYLWLKIATVGICIGLWLLQLWLFAVILTLLVAYDLYGIYQAYQEDKAHKEAEKLFKRHGLEKCKRV